MDKYLIDLNHIYIYDIRLSIMINSTQYNIIKGTNNVPHGSVFGSILFIIYIIPFSTIFSIYSSIYNLYGVDIKI